MAGIVQSHCAKNGEPDHWLLSDDQWQSIERQLGLSRRELQLVQDVFDNCTRQAIANKLGLSPHTVNSQMDRLYAKLRVRSRVGLVLRVIALCVTPPDT